METRISWQILNIPPVIHKTIESLGQSVVWADANRGDVAKALYEGTNAPRDAQQLAADRFFELGLIPTQMRIQEAGWAEPKG